MAYGIRYTLAFNNRIQNDTYRIDIYERDYSGDSTALTLGENPVTISYQDGELLDPIKASELTFTVFVNFSALDVFFSDDDEKYRVEYYYVGDSDVLLWCGYIIQDGVSEPITDRPHFVTLKATDNLALLKNVKLNETAPNDIYGQHALGYYVRKCLEPTGLYSSDTTIDKSLPLRIYANFWENSITDRSDDPTNDPFAKIILHSNVFQDSDNTWQDCYTVLEKILKDTNSSLEQSNGAWVVIRTPEYKFFNGAIPGTEYIYNGSGTDITAITLDANVTIDRKEETADCYPVLEDQIKSIQRPLKRVFNTFEYKQPILIKNADLQLPSGATPYDTNTSGDLRFDDYDLATYFPDWVQRDGDTSYLEVVTNTVTNNEEDRYIVTPSPNDTTRGVQFNPIPVSKGDKIDFSLQFKTLADTDHELLFDVRFILIGSDGFAYTIVDDPPFGSPDYELIWFQIPATEWDQQNGIHKFISASVAGNMDTTEFQTFSFSGLLAPGHSLPLVPVDSMLLIQVCGTNSNAGTENQTTGWKSIDLKISNFINQSVQISGQTHTDTGIETNKGLSESDLTIDDSPRHSIAGTLFTDDITTFGYTDSVTGENTNIGNIFFTKTTFWHRGENSEALRLGNIMAFERLDLKHTSRFIIEGTFRNLRYSDSKFISMLSFFEFVPYSIDLLPGGMEIDYMNSSFKSKLIEVVRADEDFSDEYLFNFLYKTE